MEIFVEQTLLINFFQNALILKLTSFFVKEKARFWFLISLFAGAVALVVPLFALASYAKILLQIFLAVLIVCLSFKFHSPAKFFYILVTFFIFTFILGGACFALEEAVGSYPLFIVCLVSLAIFFLVKFVIFYHNRMQRIKSFTYSVKIKANGKEVEENGYLDSGNVLLDSVTKSPIILVNYKVFKQLYDDVSLVSLLSKSKQDKINCAHYVKINSVGSGSKILAFVVDEIVLNDEQIIKNPTLALSFSGFEKSFKANVLLNSQIVFGG